MSPQEAIVKLRLRLNKLHSSSYDNIPDWTAVEAIRKAGLQVMRRTLHGINKTLEGDEETRIRVDDFQTFLSSKKLAGVHKKLYFESEPLPSNYLFYKGIQLLGTKEGCKRKRIYSSLVEEANVQAYLSDWSRRPDFMWRTTFHTLAGNRVKIYTEGEFKIDEVELTFYRKPAEFDISGYTHVDGKVSSNVNLEFKDDLAELILDEAASIIAGDLEIANVYAATKQSTDINI